MKYQLDFSKCGSIQEDMKAFPSKKSKLISDHFGTLLNE